MRRRTTEFGGGQQVLRRIRELPDGYELISATTGQHVAVRLVPWMWTVSVGGEWRGATGLWETRRLAGRLLALLLDPRSKGWGDNDRRIGLMARVVAAQRERLRAVIPAAVLAVQQAVFRETRTSAVPAEWTGLYRNKWLVADILRYRAAAVALGTYEYLFYATEMHGLEPPGPDGQSFSADDLLRALSDWRGLFSPTGESYRSLDRTLMNLPAGPVALIQYLAIFELERPETDWFHLTALCAALQYHCGDDVSTDLARVIHRASDMELRRAFAAIREHLRISLQARSSTDIVSAMGVLCLEPEPPGRKRLSGIVTQALAAPRTRRVDRRQKAWTADLSPGTMGLPTTRPPIPLPSDPALQFLATFGEVVLEGQRMGHCVAESAQDAVNGTLFFFHVSYRVWEATVALDANGRVCEATGPSSLANPASAWGRRQLRMWAAAWSSSE